jgi:hypothetical protein
MKSGPASYTLSRPGRHDTGTILPTRTTKPEATSDRAEVSINGIVPEPSSRGCQVVYAYYINYKSSKATPPPPAQCNSGEPWPAFRLHYGIRMSEWTNEWIGPIDRGEVGKGSMAWGHSVSLARTDPLQSGAVVPSEVGGRWRDWRKQRQSISRPVMGLGWGRGNGAL